MNTAGLATEQAPPLAIPLTFYGIAASALLAAGVLLTAQGALLLATHWLPQTIAWTHLATLGLLGAAMLGSLYQMVPVVLGAPVPAIRLAHAVAGLLAGGLGALVGGLTLGAQSAVLVGAGSLGLALLLFLGPMTVALARAQGGGATRTGMRGAVLCLGLLAVIGLRLAWGHGTGNLPDNRSVWLATHVALGLLGWVGGLTMAVSWQVVPMFYLTQPMPPRLMRVLAWLVPASALLAGVLGLLGAPLNAVLLAALPGAACVWLVQPVMLARLLLNRRRRRRDPTLQFWWLGLACAPLTLVAAVLSWTTSWPSAPLLFGWLAIIGWAGAIVHGVLTRIAPFLVWFHGIARQAEMPPMKQLLPDRQVVWNLRAHAATLVCGVAAILSGADWLARDAGVLLIATAALLGAALVGTVWRAR